MSHIVAEQHANKLFTHSQLRFAADDASSDVEDIKHHQQKTFYYSFRFWKLSSSNFSNCYKRIKLRLSSILFPTPKAKTKGGQRGSCASNIGRANNTEVFGMAYRGTSIRSIIPLDNFVRQRYCDNLIINSRYTAVNFIFKNLHEQFRRPLNIYFLIVALLQFISIIAPVSPMSTFIPLLLAFALTAIKEGFDDLKRHRLDQEYNDRTFLALKNGMWVATHSKDIRVGDVLKLTMNCEIPADCVAVSAPIESKGIVYIRTDNMDGENELKPRDVVHFAATKQRYNTALSISNSNNNNNNNTSNGGSNNNNSHSISHGQNKGEFSVNSSNNENSNNSLINCNSNNNSVVVGLNNMLVASINKIGDMSSIGNNNINEPEQLFGPDVFPSDIPQLLSHFTLEVPPPSPALDSFDGRLLYRSVQAASLSYIHLLPQSCYLKAAEVIVVVVYTGKDTKGSLNKYTTPIKWAKIDQQVSNYSKIIFVCQMLCAITMGFIGFAESIKAEKYWYLEDRGKEKAASAFLIYPLRFFLLTTVMIPISFKFVVDMSKYYMALVIEWDLAMYDHERGLGAKVRNSSIIEDLGQVEYILSDKTGTMTQNIMELREVSISGKRILLSSNSGLISEEDTTTVVKHDKVFSMLPSNMPLDSDMVFFWKALAICNSVEVQPKESTYEYSAVSPDEEALCRCAALHGVRLVQRSEKLATILVNTDFYPNDLPSQGREEASSTTATTSHQSNADLSTGGMSPLKSPPPQKTQQKQEHIRDEIQIYQSFPFSSEKKCMSVLYHDNATGKNYIVCKGADDKILPLLNPTFTHSEYGMRIIAKTCADLHAFARLGLRTLLISYREVDNVEIKKFIERYSLVLLEVDGRQEKLDLLRDEMECQFMLIGATAIEDKLQDGVRQTVSDLLDANLKVWMLTGDKIETAHEIAISCGLMSINDRIIEVHGPLWEESLMKAPIPSNYKLPNSFMMRHNMPREKYDDSFSQYANLDTISSSVKHSVSSNISEADRNHALINESQVHTNHVTAAALTPENNITNNTNTAICVGASNDSNYKLTTNENVPCSVNEALNNLGEETVRNATSREVDTVMIVQGGSVLDSILKDSQKQHRFLSIVMNCKSVICARVTPLQKAQITNLVRDQGKLTLAIGDGGNDVAMIQGAHIGIGIVGREGQQAARAADFAITKFKFIRSLLFVHGHQGYMRTAYVVQYSFYKSMLISFIQLYFNMTVTLMSGASFWDSLSLMAWNGVYTLPQTLFYVFDRCVPRTVLEENPFLYRLSQRGYGMTKTTFASFIFRGIVQSIAALFIVFSVMGEPGVSADGTPDVADVNFTVAYIAIILLQVVNVLIESHSIGPINATAIVGMPILYYLASNAYSKIPNSSYYGVFWHTLQWKPQLTAVMMAMLLFVPHLLTISIERCFFPNAADALRKFEVERLSHEGHKRGLSKKAHLTARNFVSQALLGIEILARIMITEEAKAEEVQKYEKELKIKEHEKVKLAKNNMAV